MRAHPLLADFDHDLAGQPTLPRNTGYKESLTCFFDGTWIALTFGGRMSRERLIVIDIDEAWPRWTILQAFNLFKNLRRSSRLGPTSCSQSERGASGIYNPKDVLVVRLDLAKAETVLIGGLHWP